MTEPKRQTIGQIVYGMDRIDHVIDEIDDILKFNNWEDCKKEIRLSITHWIPKTEQE